MKTIAYIAADAEIQAQSSKLRNLAKYNRKHLPKCKDGSLQQVSTGLLSTARVTEPSTTPFGSGYSPYWTWPNEAETSFEESKSENTLGVEQIYSILRMD